MGSFFIAQDVKM